MITQLKTLGVIAAEESGLTKEDFLGRHENPFLVQEEAAVIEDSDSEFPVIDTASFDEATARMLGFGISNYSVRSVVPIVKADTSCFEGMVNVGRTQGNDIVLEHDAVSKFHAYFLRDVATRTYCLIDAGTRNGTFVNDRRLTPNARERLGDGDIVRFTKAFGFRFYTAPGLYDLLKLLAA